MSVAEELTVALRSDGAKETQEDLEGVEQSMDETAKSAGESAEELEGFTNKFQGAMTAAVAALAVGSAGLLAQVPVLGEAMAGLFSIVEALAFQMDGVLRPVLSPLANEFFAISEMIFNAEGVTGDLIGGFTTVVSILLIAIPIIAKVGATLGVWASTGAGVVAILTKIVAVIGGVVAAILSLPATLLAAIAVVAAFAAAYALNLGGIRDTTNSVLSKVYELFLDLLDDLMAWASDLGSKAYEWGASVVDEMIAGIQSALSRLRGILDGIGSTIESRIGIDVSDIGGGGGGGDGGGSTGSGLFGGGGGGGGISLDGRQVTESTGRYRADASRRRGI